LLLAEAGQDLQSPFAGGFLLLRTWWQPGRRRGDGVHWHGRVEPNAADVEILLEAVELKQIGEFESSDVSASLADLPLEVANDSLHVVLVEAGLEELIPEPFPIKAQAQALAGQAAI
jgi:hypothetical protein